MVIRFFKVLLCILLLTACSNPQELGLSSAFFTKKFTGLEFKYSVSELNRKTNKYVDVIKEEKIDPEQSALVLIDVWEDDFLTPWIKRFVNPLIKELDKLGFKIIYSPSTGTQNKELFLAENSAVFYGYDTMDQFIRKNNIKNLFYLGFDTLYCVMDKPNGLFSFKQRVDDEDLGFFVFEQGVTSSTKEMKDAALLLYKKKNIGVLGSSEYFQLESVYPSATSFNKNLNTVLKTKKGKKLIVLFKSKDSQNNELENFETKLVKLGVEYASVIDGILYYKNKKIDADHDFFNLLIKNDIKNILYGGYYLNDQILLSKYGVTNLYMHKISYDMKDELPKSYIIKDLSYIIENEDYDSSVEKITLLNHYRGIQNITSKYLLLNYNQ